MFDQRNLIVALFTNGKISATTEGGTKYISIMLREDNENQTTKDNDVGLILLEPPTGIPHIIKLNGKSVSEMTTIFASMFINKNSEMKHPDEYVNSIIDGFQNKIVDNCVDTTNNRWVTFDGVVDVPSQSPDLIRKTMMLSAYGFKVR